MDVAGKIGGDYIAPPTPGSGEFAPAPKESFDIPAPAPVKTTSETRSERDYGESRDLQSAVSEINSAITIYKRHLAISHHEATNRRVVTVYDSETNDVVRQIPPESVLDAHACMLEMVGLFVDARG